MNEIQTNREKLGRPIAPAATTEELRMVQEEATQKLRYTLPPAYLDLLRLSNGLDWNGVQLYASQPRTRVTPEGRMKYLFRGIVEANEQWRDFPPNEEFIFFAESGDVLYCYNLTSGKFEIVDRITKEMDDDQTDAFDTCEELLETLLNHMLDRYEGEV
ncbi:YrhA family protein [Hymenobacter terrenus]|uniref:YrhA family protein n=1 Tax=Hymenobacter terrenus TaxID=1629124 RepID=UPI001E5DAA9A|nr:YrhA family protein [Hymenobacter terrenus]